MLDIVYAESVEDAFESWKDGKILCTARLSAEERGTLKAMIRISAYKKPWIDTSFTYQM